MRPGPLDSSAAFHRILSSREELLETLVEDAEAYLLSRIENEDLVYRAVLLLSEAATNAMKHGNAFDPEKQVRVAMAVEGEGEVVAMRVCDEGPGFDPNAPEDPLGAENLLRPTGRGIFLIREMADEVSFDDEGRCVIMRIRG